MLSANELARSLGLHHELPFLEILLPVGISFFTFHGISYIVDVYRGDVEVCRNPLDMALYMSFFPQLVAGPIVRAADFLPQLARPTTEPIPMRAGAAADPVGLFKKVVIANYLATGLVDPVFAAPTSYGGPDLLLAIYGYAVQIYCDFSAYSDIAIGSRRCSATLSGRISTSPTAPNGCASSGGAGTSRCRPGCATTSTSRSAATATAGSRPISTCC